MEYCDKLKLYTANELLDILSHIDKEKVPERYSMLKAEILQRKAENNFIVVEEYPFEDYKWKILISALDLF